MVWLFAFFISTASAQKLQIERPFLPFVADWIIKSEGMFEAKDFRHATIQFKKLEGTIIGYCYTDWKTLNYTIEIDSIYWAETNFTDHWALLFHEMGHCMCARQHTTTKGLDWFLDLLERFGLLTIDRPQLKDGCPTSLMAWDAHDTECYIKHRQYYIKEMFSNCKKLEPPPF